MRGELAYLAVAGPVAAAAVAVITWQQLAHTPLGLPGHRGVFWLSALIASRLTSTARAPRSGWPRRRAA
jgi:hypothetical protein